MSVQPPSSGPAPGGVPSGRPTRASSVSAPQVGQGAPYPGFSPNSSYHASVADDRFGYAPGAPTVGEFVAPHFPGTEYVEAHAVFADGGYTSPRPITNATARAALWFSVFSFLLIPVVISAVLAVIALVSSRSLPDNVGTHDAVAALVYDGVFVLVVGAVWVL